MIAPDVKSRLQTVAAAADGAVEPAPAALALSAAVSGAGDVGPYLRHLDAVADGVAGYVRGAEDAIDLRVEALGRILAAHYGYGTGTEDGGEWDDDEDGGAEPACLAATIDRRHGTGLTVGLLYLHAARTQGWAADAVDFPGRFLIRLDHDGERRIVDPAAAGRARGAPDLRALLKEAAGAEAELAPEHFRPLENRAVLYRYQAELKMRLLRDGRLEDALRAVEGMLLAAPKAAPLWREAGLMHARLDNLPAAVLALEHFLQVADEGDGRYKASILLNELRGRLPH